MKIRTHLGDASDRKSACSTALKWSWILSMALIVETGWLPSVSIAQAVQEVRVRWDAYAGTLGPLVAPGAAPPANSFTVLERKRGSGSMPRQRNPEPSSNQIVVLAMSAAGKVIDGHLIPDPRILRAEGPNASGDLTGQVVHRTSTELLIAVPDDPAIVELQLYHPHWTGTTFVFDLIGTIPLR
jgi:hypothetical protein